MVGIIIATHGEFAKGILQSSNMVFGEQEKVCACTFMPNEGPDDIKAKMQKAIDSFDATDEVLFLVDLWSGTPFNQASLLLDAHKDKWAIVSGLNLPMLIEAISLREDVDKAHEIAANILTSAREDIMSYLKVLNLRRNKTKLEVQ